MRKRMYIVYKVNWNSLLRKRKLMQDMHIVWADWDALLEKAQANRNIRIVVCENGDFNNQ